METTGVGKVIVSARIETSSTSRRSSMAESPTIKCVVSKSTTPWSTRERRPCRCRYGSFLIWASGSFARLGRGPRAV